MILSNWNEEDRRALAATYVGRGWELLKIEFELRKKNLIHKLVYGADRASDQDSRAMVAALDMLERLEKETFAVKVDEEQPFSITPQTDRTTRY